MPMSEKNDKEALPKRYIGVMFECCRVYTRIYINRDATAYAGSCPRCRRKLQVKIDPARGIDARFFRAR